MMSLVTYCAQVQMSSGDSKAYIFRRKWWAYMKFAMQFVLAIRMVRADEPNSSGPPSTSSSTISVFDAIRVARRLTGWGADSAMEALGYGEVATVEVGTLSKSYFQIGSCDRCMSFHCKSWEVLFGGGIDRCNASFTR